MSDLTPLKGLLLTRLVFDPARIEQGLDIVRTMPSLRELGVEMRTDTNTLMAPAVFWQQYSQGTLVAKR